MSAHHPTDGRNVIRLPTAAPRKVQRPSNRASRAAKRKLQEECPWPGEYLYPGQRKAMKTAELLMEVERTPELELLTAICSTLDDATREKVAAKLALRAAVGITSAEKAEAVFRSTRLTVGETLDLTNALQRMSKGLANV